MTHSVDLSAKALLLTALTLLAACSENAPLPDQEPKQPDPEVALAAKAPPAAKEESAAPSGRWFEMRKAAPARRKTDLAGLGYSGAYEEGGELSGALTRDADHVAPGLTLFCSGHDTSVLLIDVEGTVVHHWHLDFDEIFPDPLPFEAMDFHSEFVRRAWAFPNGDLLAIFEYTGITRVNAEGKPLWAVANRSHHDFKALDDGTIVTLDIEERDMSWLLKQYRCRRFRDGVIDSHVMFLNAEGELVRKISIFDAIYRSRFTSFIHSIPLTTTDVFHANSVDVLDATAAAAFPMFEEGDILVSLRTLNALVVIDGDTEEVKWLSQGLTCAQHQASFLPSGSIMVLDNCGGNQKFPLRSDQSRIIEIDPATDDITWCFPARGQRFDFFTGMLGYVERLPGGNTLITESMQGHLIEVTPQGDVVWEYYSPYRAGENDELITTLMGARRVSPEALPFLRE